MVTNIIRLIIVKDKSLTWT